MLTLVMSVSDSDIKGFMSNKMRISRTTTFVASSILTAMVIMDFTVFVQHLIQSVQVLVKIFIHITEEVLGTW